MERGSLRRVMGDDEEAKKLDWRRRINVVKGVAHALSHMHHDRSPPIVHCDISSGNILIDADYEAKISDFGTAKLLKVDSSNLLCLDSPLCLRTHVVAETLWLEVVWIVDSQGVKVHA